MDNDARRAATDATDGRATGTDRGGPGDPGASGEAGAPGEADRVARFLRRNPDWLSRQPGLYECLSPPRRVHGEALADHMAAMIDAARDRSRTVLDAGRAGLGLIERVREAVLALIRLDEPWDWIAVDLPRLLGIDAARLCVEAMPGGASYPGSMVPAETVARVLGPRDVVLRAGADRAETALLHGEAAGLALHEALLRVRIDGHPPALLALAARAPGVLDGLGADGALGFLATALAARLERA